MERFDLYDKDRMPLNQTMERGGQVPDGCYRIVVHACIFNNNGEMLIQRRQPFKDGWSGMWDISCGGSAISGETSQEAAEREIREELGLNISMNKMRPALTIHRDPVFDDIYVVNKEVELSELVLQPEEVQCAKWALPEEIFQMIDNGEFIPYYEELIRLLFFMKDQKGGLKWWE